MTMSETVDRADGYELTLTRRPEYLHAYVKGPADSKAINESYFQRIANNRGGYRRILIEEDLGTPLPFADIFDVVVAIASQANDGTRIAFIDRQPAHRAGNIFGANVAVNRGIQVRICDSIADAEDWLLGGSPNQLS